MEKKNGKYKEVFKNGNLKFKGEYLNGKRWNGEFYNYKNGKLEAEIKNGNGKIKEYWEMKLVCYNLKENI